MHPTKANGQNEMPFGRDAGASNTIRRECWCSKFVLGRAGIKISVNPSEDHDSSYVLQQISVSIQCYNAILLHQSFMVCTEENCLDNDR